MNDTERFANAMAAVRRGLLMAAIAGVRESYRIAFGSRPEDINDGNCEGFAIDVKRMVPFVEVWGGDHYALGLDGRWYDAEDPVGVDDWRRLRCFQREFARGLRMVEFKLVEPAAEELRT